MLSASQPRSFPCFDTAPWAQLLHQQHFTWKWAGLGHCKPRDSQLLHPQQQKSQASGATLLQSTLFLSFPHFIWSISWWYSLHHDNILNALPNPIFALQLITSLSAGLITQWGTEPSAHCLGTVINTLTPFIYKSNCSTEERMDHQQAAVGQQWHHFCWQPEGAHSAATWSCRPWMNPSGDKVVCCCGVTAGTRLQPQTHHQ